MRRYQDMNVIRHDDERMQLIAPKPVLAIAQSRRHQPGDIRPTQE
jgi:hypothetical protein